MTRGESGNAFFIILIGVVLFAALAFTYTKGSQQGGESISLRQAELATSDIITFSQRVTRTVDQMLRQGKSETQISFEGLKDNYANAACLDDSCKVFVSSAQGILPVYPLVPWLDSTHSANYAYQGWYISAQFCVPGIPDNTCAAPKGNDLVLMLPYLKKDLCSTINKKLGITGAIPAPSSFGSVGAAARFDGSFSPAGGTTLWDAAALNGQSAACVTDGTAYYYYQVLIAR